MSPRSRNAIKGFVEVDKLPKTYFIDPIFTKKYKKQQDKIVNFLKAKRFLEVHLPLFIPKKFLDPIKNIPNDLFISTFSGKDKRTVFFLRPFWGFLSGIPFVLNNVRSYKQLPLYLIEKAPLYGNFPQKWKLSTGGVEDYLGLHGVLISSGEKVSPLVDQIAELLHFLEINPIEKKKEIFYKVETISFYYQEIFVCACFNFKDMVGKQSEIYYHTTQQKLKPISWHSFYWAPLVGTLTAI